MSESKLWRPAGTTPGDPCRDLWQTAFCGQPAIQLWSDLMNWDRWLDAFEPKGLIELGAGYGGLSLYLAVEAAQREMVFETFDWHVPPAASTVLWKRLGVVFHHIDFHKDIEFTKGRIRALPQPRCLLCDGGKKPFEFATFTPALEPGDFVAVHDWTTEFGEADIDPVRSMVENIWAAESEAVGTLTRWFRRI